MTDSRPELSIVVASVSGRPYLDACLEALEQQEDRISAEVIVADGVGASVRDLLRTRHPRVRLLAFDEPKSVPELRAAGIEAARGEIVVITEDHCIPRADWYRAIVAAHDRSAQPAIGGAVDNAATEHIVDWAVFFCEYSNFMSPVDEGVVHDLPGPNVSYKRWALEEMTDLLQNGYWETFLHWRLEEKGYELVSDSRIRVLHKKHYRFGEFLAERYHYGRTFAGTRNEFTSRGRRIFHLLGSPALPPILMFRIARRVLRRHHHLAVYVKALPLIASFMFAWAAGEWVGYAFGAGSRSMELS